jgi:hypothetical protein
MPTVLRVAGFRFYFYSGDHLPAHVHVRNGDGVVVIEIETTKVRRTEGEVREKDLTRAKSLVAEHRVLLRNAWDDFERSKGDR